MNTLEYKKYYAKIEFSAEDNALIGTVVGMADTLIFDCEKVEDLERTFHSVIDDYLETCERLGKSPEKAYSGSFNVRMAPELHKQAVLKATTLSISLNEFVAKSVEQAIKESPNENGAYKRSLKRLFSSFPRALSGGRMIPYAPEAERQLTGGAFSCNYQTS